MLPLLNVRRYTSRTTPLWTGCECPCRIADACHLQVLAQRADCTHIIVFYIGQYGRRLRIAWAGVLWVPNNVLHTPKHERLQLIVAPIRAIHAAECFLQRIRHTGVRRVKMVRNRAALKSNISFARKLGGSTAGSGFGCGVGLCCRCTYPESWNTIHCVLVPDNIVRRRKNIPSRREQPRREQNFLPHKDPR